MTEIVCSCIAAVASIIVAIVGWNVKKTNAKMEKENAKRDAREELREKSNILSLRMMDATLQLSVVSSNALTGGHNNGNVERARETAQKVADEYEEFMREITAHELCK